MNVTRDDVLRCAQLAHIGLHEDEIEPLCQALGRVLDRAQNLNQLNLDKIEPYTHGAAVVLPRRSDDAKTSLSQAEALANAPQISDGYFLVPKVM